MIGNLAKTYGMLPSQVSQIATSFDIMVTDIMTTWENYRRNPGDSSNYNQEQLNELMKDL